MANEARVGSSLGIVVRNEEGITLLEYQSRPASFQADVAGAKGPTPGAITVTQAGTDIDLSQLVSPGLCHLMNMDADLAILLGRWDPDTNRYYPFLKLLPTESYAVRLSDDVDEEYSGTGSGTTETISTLRAKVVGGESATLFVGAFES